MGKLNAYKNLINGKSLKEAEGLFEATSKNHAYLQGRHMTGDLKSSAIVDRATEQRMNAEKAMKATKSATNKARIGTGAGVGALTAGGAYASNQKTASDIVDEAFEKM